MHTVWPSEKGRRYHHVLVKLFDDKPVAHTLPFYFFEDAVEYCLSMDIRDGVISTIVSRNDADPTLVRMKLSDFEFRKISECER